MVRGRVPPRAVLRGRARSGIVATVCSPSLTEPATRNPHRLPSPTRSRAAAGSRARSRTPINNPLQVVRLLLEKKNVTKKEIEEGVASATRTHRAGNRPAAGIRRGGSGRAAKRPAGPPAQRAAEAVGIELQGSDIPAAFLDEANYTDRPHPALFQAVQGPRHHRTRRAPERAPRRDHGAPHPGGGRVSRDDELDALDASVFVVGPEREVLPGLALSRMLLEASRGRLEINRSATEVTFRAIVPQA